MFRTIVFLVVFAISAVAETPTNTASPARTEEQVWNMEKAYWEYVKTSDAEKYRALWHERFLGWPSFSSTPVGKDHITDWITKNTSKGVTLHSYEIEQLGIRITGDIAITHYRVKMQWTGPKQSDNETKLSRIHHTWIRTGNTWQILAGMSAAVNRDGK